MSRSIVDADGKNDNRSSAYDGVTKGLDDVGGQLAWPPCGPVENPATGGQNRNLRRGGYDGHVRVFNRNVERDRHQRGGPDISRP